MTALIRHTWKCPKCGKVQRTEIRVTEIGHRCPSNKNAVTLFTYVSGPPPPDPDEPVIL